MAYEYVSDDQKAANALVGKTIRKVLVEPGEETLVFETDEGEVLWGTYGDCCSETWFADILNFDALKGGKVVACEPVEMPEQPDDKRTRQEYDSFYSFKITTDKGVCDIIYRNSSNGYYGGNACLVSKRPEQLVEITADWQAGEKAND